jgi:hypothetical protein
VLEVAFFWLGSEEKYMTETSAAQSTNSSEPPSKKQKVMSPSNGTADAAVPAAFEQTSLLVQKLSPKGRVPTRGSPMSAGYDLYSYLSLNLNLGLWHMIHG